LKNVVEIFYDVSSSLNRLMKKVYAIT